MPPAFKPLIGFVTIRVVQSIGKLPSSASVEYLQHLQPHHPNLPPFTSLELGKESCLFKLSTETVKKSKSNLDAALKSLSTVIFVYTCKNVRQSKYLP